MIYLLLGILGRIQGSLIGFLLVSLFILFFSTIFSFDCKEDEMEIKVNTDHAKKVSRYSLASVLILTSFYFFVPTKQELYKILKLNTITKEIVK